MPKRNLLILFVALVAGLLSWMARDHAGHGRRFAEVLTAIEQRYVKPVDRDALFTAAMNGVFATLDEHSGFLAGAEQDELNAVLDQEFGGVGLQLALADGRIVVQAPIPQSPAWRAGIAGGDVIEAVDGRPTEGLSLDEVVADLRGTPGTIVVVGVATPRSDAVSTLDPGAAAVPPARRSVALTRERVAMESVRGDRRLPDGSWNWWLEGEKGVALIRILHFGERTADEVRAALEAVSARCAADGVQGVVIDLRGNGGGLLDAAVDVCDLLISEGVIVSTRAADGGLVPREATAGRLLPDVPMVVLVDGLTASAAEIVAACLQDSGRATIVGSRSYGKGTVQSLLPLSDGSATLKLTTAEYLRPSMNPIHRDADDDIAATWGVRPLPEHEITPPRQQSEGAAAWRQARDAEVFPDDRPSCCGSPSRAALQMPVIASPPPAGKRPRDADTVLARGLEALGM
jgi:carboxyl-terminal processing protease